MLATNVLKSSKNKKEVKNDLLSMMAPPDGLEPNDFKSYHPDFFTLQTLVKQGFIFL